MFIGEYQHAIDSKNRIIIPSKFREELGSTFVITKGLDGCLYCYPMDEWKKLEEKLKALPLTNKDARAFVRFFFSGAADIEVDKQGRALIPQNLIEYAGIIKEIVSIGVSNRIEIWSKEKWDEYNEQNINYEEIAEKMSILGIGI
ncbi:division/cell wall cluster transcriptional repressor MraZ [Caloramator sp. E03]|uniref:division/cell wall cluster transcriptional repressor MraZ n=1 Tax=Caloramator sp. E03 TaxID=2576307 RepID=UPI0011108828|nr:division/cell wall cluster transcriptional repressor MraZ [Caloramator sp. E03]QCX32588.1 division/cell wall cluster transcriptional repressor MraZ [Caloramator sp. E03]